MKEEAKGTNGSEILKALPEGSEIYTDNESIKAVVIKVPKKWWDEQIKKDESK